MCANWNVYDVKDKLCALIGVCVLIRTNTCTLTQLKQALKVSLLYPIAYFSIRDPFAIICRDWKGRVGGSHDAWFL